MVAAASRSLRNSAPQQIQLIVSEDQTYTVAEKHAAIELSEKGDLKINSEQIRRQSSKDEKVEKSGQYNQLITPKGKHSKLTLPDGTQVYANSGTRIVFPEKFQGNKREIFVDGEVYLDVYHNQNRPFVVRTNKMEIEVLGTSFNVSAYSQDIEQSVVLVSGSVAVKTNKKEEFHLLPNQRISYGTNVAVTNVAVERFIAWKDGILLCNNESLVSVIERISRYYGVDIECDNDIHFYTGNGKLDLKEDLRRVLDGLIDIFPIVINEGKNGKLYVAMK